MSFLSEEPVRPALASFASGQATFDEVWAASRDVAIYVDNFNGEWKALEEAYDRRIALIKRETGVTIAHPLREPRTLRREMGDQRMFARGVEPEHIAKAAFNEAVARVAEQFPPKAAIIKAGVAIEEDAKGIAREAEERLGRVLASRDDVFGKWTAAVGGGFTGSLRDPVQVGALVLGGGAGAARTVAGRVLTVALKEMAINGAVEAAMQPKVQAWRAEVGLPHGFGEAARNVAFAALPAAGLGAVVQGGAEILGRTLFKGPALDSAAASLAAKLDPGTPAAQALNGSVDASAELLKPIREALPAEARGALDAREALGDIVGQGPHGPIIDVGAHGRDWKKIKARLDELGEGEAPGALSHPDVGPIDIMRGKWDAAKKVGYGLEKLRALHPEVIEDLPQLIAGMKVASRSANRIILESAEHRALVRLDWDGAEKTWLLTAYSKDGRRGGGSTLVSSGHQADHSSASPTPEDIVDLLPDVDPTAPSGPRQRIDEARQSDAIAFAEDPETGRFSFEDVPSKTAAPPGPSPEANKTLEAEAPEAASSKLVEESEYRSFESFDALKDALGPAGPDKVWHHIVEQSQGKSTRSVFPLEMINSTKNVVAIPRKVNSRLADRYGSKWFKFTKGKRLRDWVNGKSFDEQFEFGKTLLKEEIEKYDKDPSNYPGGGISKRSGRARTR